jgi:hypothetical protein
MNGISRDIIGHVKDDHSTSFCLSTTHTHPYYLLNETCITWVYQTSFQPTLEMSHQYQHFQALFQKEGW